MAHKSREEMQKLIEQGLERAALRAREIAFQTNTPLVIEEDGEVRRVWVTEEDIEAYRESIRDAL